MRYPPQFLDRIRQHFRLSEVIGRHLTLRKAGREYHALCPFHNEKTPSFTINDEKAFYHCFGCGAHGDVINFVKEYEGLGWGQAVESLAREAGLELPKTTPEAREKLARTEVLFGTVEKSAAFFSQKLRETPGAAALDYLTQRGIHRETMAVFRLGYAPDSREALKSHLSGLGISLRDMEDAGLLSRSDSGAIFDKFRGRVIFPIRDISGRVVGFGGRLLVEAERAPKYLNSPQTMLFDKGRLLYNADQARLALSRGQTLVMAEGYMDVIALHQAGFAASVAPLGTAVTEDHLKMMWQLADEPVVCLDGDNAGWRAMQRVTMLALPLLKPGKSLRFCLLPEGEDPDSLIKTRGARAMQEAMNGALPLAEMLWRLEVTEKPATTPEQRAAAEQRIMRAVESIQDMGVRRAYRDDMRQRFWQAGREVRRVPRTEAAFELHSLIASAAGSNDASWRRDTCIRQILSILMYFPKLLENRDIEEGFTVFAPSQPALMEFHRRLTDVYMHGDFSRAAFLAEAEKAESAAWQGYKRQFDLQQLLKQPEEEGQMQAKRYCTRLLSQLVEIQLEADMAAVAEQMQHDPAACERFLALQQQLQRLKSQDALLLGETLE